MSVKVLYPPTLSNHQFFLQWFADACGEVGIGKINNVLLPWKCRLLVAKSRVSRNIPLLSRNRDVLIVPCAGYPDSFAFPFSYAHEIVPVLWDTWPRYHRRIVQSFKRHHVRLAFFTQRQVAEWVSMQLPSVKCVWMPEAVNPDGYKAGKNLLDRNTDVLELGRLFSRLHDDIKDRGFTLLYRDPSQGLLFKDFDALANGLADAKITVSFPRCDTNPEHAGDIETMTQRYWECMLSRTLIYGRVPKELIDFAGYNPGIEVDWSNPHGQVKDMLAHIGSFQELVDRNLEFAKKQASWSSRMALLCGEIKALR